MPLDSSINFGKRNEYVFLTKSIPIFTELEKRWYRQGDNKRIKIIPSDLKLTPLSVCVWFMDDGTNYPQKRQAKFATNCFTKEECEQLANGLVKLGIVASVQPWKHQYLVYIGSKSYLDFIHMIKPHCIWGCYQYKHDLSKIPRGCLGLW